MIRLRLKFADEEPRKFDIIDGECLNDAVIRALAEVPQTPFGRSVHWLVVVNGHCIDGAFWEKVKLREKDTVTISPKITSGDSGQILKTGALIAIAVVASVLFTPAAGAGFWASVAGGLEVAAVTIGASLLLNSLIPPPVANLGNLSGVGGTIDNSQMYSFSGQSNQVQRLGTCPKVYGAFRMFPNIAATPYTELSVSEGDQALAVIGNLIFTANQKGNIGNSISIIYQSGGTAGSERVLVKDKTITITFAGGASTGTQIKTAVAANAAAAALVSCIVTGIDVGQSFVGTAKLANGKDGGELVQYLYVIYDFGLGTYRVNNLQIGDTPIALSNYADFHYNFVDPAKTSNVDVYDQSLNTEFKYYKTSRQITSLAIVLDADGTINIQNSDVNIDGVPQELVLDFLCPRGLFGFTSSGTLGDRSVDLEIEFAPVGTSFWSSYNDLSVVDNHQVVGGVELTEVKSQFGQTITSSSDSYYETLNEYVGFGGFAANIYLRPGVTSTVMAPGTYVTGAKCFYGNQFIGYVTGTDYITQSPNVVVSFDRPISPNRYSILAYSWKGFVTTYHSTFRFTSQTSGIATITGKSTSAVYGSVRFTPKIAGQYQVRVRRIRSYGTAVTQTQDGVTWGALTTAYLKNPINTKLRHTFMELKIRATDQLNGNISTLSGVCSSVIPVYDPVTGIWTRQITSNPAWVFADLLTGEVNKRAITHDKLDLNSLVEWANYCDQVPSPPPSQVFTQPRFTCNFILDYQTTLQDALAQVGGSAQASLNLIDGKYGVLIDKHRDTPVQIFTPRNSRDFSSTRVYTKRPDGVKITWIDPAVAWSTSEVQVYDNGFNENNSVTLDSLTAFACTNHEQAWRFGRYMIAQNRLRQETINILVDFEYLACSRGDYVQVTQDVMEVGGTPARVKSVVGNVVIIDDSIDVDVTLSYGYVYRSAVGEILTSTLTASAPNTFTLNGGIPAVGDLIVVGVVGQLVLDCIVKAISPNDDLSATLVLVEKADDIFNYESSGVLPDYNPQISATSSLDKPPKAITNLVIPNNTWRCSALRSGLDYYVDLSWDIPNGSVYELFEIWVNDGRGYKSVATTTSKNYTYSVDQSRLDIAHGFKVVAVSATGKKLELAAMTTATATPATKTIPPSDVQNFNVSITDQTLQLTWSPIDDCDAFQYVLRYSPDVSNVLWNFSVPLAVVTSAFNTFSCQARTGTYFVKAIDYAGNESVNAGVAITTIPNLFGITDITSIDEAPTFIGERTQSALLGSAVILTEQIPGDINTVKYYDLGYYTFAELLDLSDIYTVRLQSLLQADGFKKGELMSDWVELDLVDHLSSVVHDDWNVALEYRATTVFDSMADWVSLNTVDHINFGGGAGFTTWRDIPQVGDVTGRVFQFRVRMESLIANVTPRVFDTTVNAYMPDRLESFNNIISSASIGTTVTYTTPFAGPGTTPNIQISVDNGATGDYWTFDSKTLDSFSIRFYDKNGTQVVRQFDAAAKGYGHKYAAVI